jgi:hypothetical protein
MVDPALNRSDHESPVNDQSLTSSLVDISHFKNLKDDDDISEDDGEDVIDEETEA